MKILIQQLAKSEPQKVYAFLEDRELNDYQRIVKVCDRIHDAKALVVERMGDRKMAFEPKHDVFENRVHLLLRARRLVLQLRRVCLLLLVLAQLVRPEHFGFGDKEVVQRDDRYPPGSQLPIRAVRSFSTEAFYATVAP
mgnify:CR=1 FL=1